MRLSKTLVLAMLGAAPLLCAAQVSININVPGLVTVAPPAPRFERVPPPRAGYVWAPGHWQWERDAYQWRGGYWEPARPDSAYAPGRWVRADGGWRWVEPDWRPVGKGKGKGRGHGGHDERGGHCPPGQAKKGNC